MKKHYSLEDIEVCLTRLGETEADCRDSFRLLMDRLDQPVTDNNGSKNPASGLLQQWRVYAPLSVVALVLVIGGAFVLQANQGGQNTVIRNAPVANGTTENANAAILQDNSEESTTASNDDGTVDIYTAQANSLQKLGDSIDVSF